MDSQTYNVVWVVNNVIKETIAYNKPRVLARYLAIQARNNTHKTGQIKLLPVKTSTSINKKAILIKEEIK